ncbi:MAG: DUF4837 family protein [Bacteroidota bacterium]|nr:DUF4837 family protein [Bacteroidota bacterium]
MKLLQGILPLGCILFLLACGERTVRLPRSVGGQGEILVVMQKGHWDGAPGTAIREIFEKPMAGLPQREPRFKVAYTTPEGFGSLLTAHHNVILALIGTEADTTAFFIQKNVHATGQLLLRAEAKDPVRWIELFRQKSDDLVAIFEEHHRQRIIARLSTERDVTIGSSVKAAHDMTLLIPGGFRVIVQDTNFSWIQRDQMRTGSGLDHNVIEGILIYHYPYVSDSTFNVDHLVNVRDEFTKAYVKGPAEGSYMIVQRGFEGVDLMPGGRAAQINGKFAYVMNGLFGMKGAKMGGPFVSLTTIDEQRQRVVTVEGFVYAPQFDKREHVRELEAILFSLQIEPALNDQ